MFIINEKLIIFVYKSARRRIFVKKKKITIKKKERKFATKKKGDLLTLPCFGTTTARKEQQISPRHFAFVSKSSSSQLAKIFLIDGSEPAIYRGRGEREQFNYTWLSLNGTLNNFTKWGNEN